MPTLDACCGVESSDQLQPWHKCHNQLLCFLLEWGRPLAGFPVTSKHPADFSKAALVSASADGELGGLSSRIVLEKFVYFLVCLVWVGTLSSDLYLSSPICFFYCRNSYKSPVSSLGPSLFSVVAVDHVLFQCGFGTDVR